jgi:hypothetical protein
MAAPPRVSDTASAMSRLAVELRPPFGTGAVLADEVTPSDAGVLVDSGAVCEEVEVGDDDETETDCSKTAAVSFVILNIGLQNDSGWV